MPPDLYLILIISLLLIVDVSTTPPLGTVYNEFVCSFETSIDFLRLSLAAAQNLEDPTAHFTLGQFYRYTCQHDFDGEGDGDGQSRQGFQHIRESCAKTCSSAALERYLYTRNLIRSNDLNEQRDGDGDGGTDTSSQSLSSSLSLPFYPGMLNDLALMIRDIDINAAAEYFTESITIAPNFVPSIANLAALEMSRGNISGT